MMAVDAFFFFKETLVCPTGLSHFSADGTVFYSYCVKLSVYALHVSPEASEQMTRTIAPGGKTAFESISSGEDFSRVSRACLLRGLSLALLLVCSLALLVDYTKCFICI